jgi:hypothetical protein
MHFSVGGPGEVMANGTLGVGVVSDSNIRG